jgi:hypothetical protein
MTNKKVIILTKIKDIKYVQAKTHKHLYIKG